MSRTTRILSILIAFAVAGSAAASVIVTDQWRNEFAIRTGGTLVIDNPIGNVDVVAGNGTKVVVTADRVIRAVEAGAVTEAKKHVQRAIEGDERVRVVRTIVPAVRNAQWTAAVNYVVNVPRDINVKIQSNLSERLRIAGIRGAASIKNFSGMVIIDSIGGSAFVDSVNGNVLYVTNGPLPANTRLFTVNGHIEVRVSAQSNFVWETEAITGDSRTVFGVYGGQFVKPRRFVGRINVPTNVTLVTETFGGNVLLTVPGADSGLARSVRTMVARIQSGPQVPVAMPKPKGGLSKPRVEANLTYETSIGDVAIGEIRGDTQILTGAGEIRLGTVTGRCHVVSHGGPLTLGDIHGELTARTAGGNVSIGTVRTGGVVQSGGGTIRVNSVLGPLRLMSGGGDVVIRQTSAPINAETKSGDVSITVDPHDKTQKLFARTLKGNVTLHIPDGFGADVEAIMITSDPTATIRTDVQGLAIQRDQVDGKTRIRATGLINGGGERVELYTEDGGIQIISTGSRVSPIIP